MAGEDEGLEDRTEEATSQRRDDWRKEGRVSQSRELGGAMALLGVSGALYATAGWSMRGLSSVFEVSFRQAAEHARGDFSIGLMGSVLNYSMKSILYIAGPACVAAMVVGVLVTLAQTGIVWTAKPLEMDLDKLNPINGAKRIFSFDGLVEMTKAILKFTIVFSVVYGILKSRLRQAGGLWDVETPSLVLYMGQQIIVVLSSVGISLAVMAGLDYAYQRFRFEQKIRMTKEEVKEERKQSEGNPHTRARVRGLQRRVSQNRMIEAVKGADVVITNPTHIAVALVYDRENMLAPRVVAKGADFMAERIKKVARENGIPCVENVPLARALYKALKIGQLISRDLYNAVAEVLAYVYRLKGRVMS